MNLRRFLRLSARLLIAVFVLTPHSHVSARQLNQSLSVVKVVAVAPFADDVRTYPRLARWAAVRLTELLPKAVFQVVPFETVERALKDMRRSPADLIRPTASAELGQQVAADAVIAGRLTRADVDRDGGVTVFPSIRARGPAEAIVTVDLQMALVATHQVLVRTEVAGFAVGGFALERAAEAALRDFTRLIATTTY